MILFSPYEVSDPEPVIPNAANLDLLYHFFLFVADILYHSYIEFFRPVCYAFR